MSSEPGLTVSQARVSKNLAEQVAHVIEAAVQLSVEPESYGSELHLDSIGILQMIVGLEKKFSLVIDEEDLDPLTTFNSVDSIAEYVYEKTAVLGSGGR